MAHATEDGAQPPVDQDERPGQDVVPAQLDYADDEAFSTAFNDLIVSTFHSIERYEELSLRSFEENDLSIAESHLVEAVGRECQNSPAGVPVSQVAHALGVRVPTATASVNKLVAKGLLSKERSRDDQRSFLVRLTRQGRRAYRLHALFHRRMVDALAGDLTAQERAVLTRGLAKLKRFFEQSAANTPAAMQKNPR